MKDWDSMTVAEQINSFPARHPFTFKAVLWLVIFKCTAVSWEAVDILMQHMGFVRIDVQRMSEDKSMGFSAPTYVSPDEGLNTVVDLSEGEER